MRLGSTDDDDHDNDDTGRRRRMGSNNNHNGIFSNTAEGNCNKKYVVLGIIGLLLFFMTLSLNIFGKWLVNKYSENY